MAGITNERPDNETRKRRVKRIGFGLLMLTPFLIAWLVPPEFVHSKYSICFFRTVTDKPCPFCGLTRAYVHAAHGDFKSASLYHPFWWIAAMVMVVTAASALIDGLFGTRTLMLLKRLVLNYVWVVVAIIVAFGVYRLIHPL